MSLALIADTPLRTVISAMGRSHTPEPGAFCVGGGALLPGVPVMTCGAHTGSVDAARSSRSVAKSIRVDPDEFAATETVVVAEPHLAGVDALDRRDAGGDRHRVRVLANGFQAPELFAATGTITVPSDDQMPPRTNVGALDLNFT